MKKLLLLALLVSSTAGYAKKSSLEYEMMRIEMDMEADAQFAIMEANQEAARIQAEIEAQIAHELMLIHNFWKEVDENGNVTNWESVN